MEDKDLRNQVVPVSNTELEEYEQLKHESAEIIKKILSSKNLSSETDLTYLFNMNQLKKTLARIDSYNNLLDALTKQAIKRVIDHPEEIETTQLFNALKIIQDLMEKSTISTQEKQKDDYGTFIQINQTKTEIHVDKNKSDVESLDRTSRKNIEDYVLSVINAAKNTPTSDNVIDAEINENGDDTHE